MLLRHHEDLLERHRPELVKEIDPDSLFPELRARKLVRSRREADIKGEKLRDTQVEKILDLLLCSHEDAFDLFCDALIASDQERIVTDYLKPAIKKETGLKQRSDNSWLSGIPPKKKKRETEMKKSSSSNTLSRQFQAKWKEDFPWVDYCEATNTMHCVLCRQQSSDKIWATSGTSNFRRKTITDHENSAEHRRSVEVVQQPSNASWEKRQEDIGNALRVCFNVMIEDSAKFQSFFNRIQDGDNAPLDLSDKFYELVQCLSDVIEDHLRSEIRWSPHIGIRLDEWADRTGGKYLIVNARYVSPAAQIKTAFLQCISGYDGKTVSIQRAVHDIANYYDIPLTKIVGLGTDCASVMANKLPDVTKSLKEDSPHMVFLHCVCHRLNLAVSQMCDDVPSIEILQSIVAAAYTFASMSQRRLKRVYNMKNVLDRERVGVQCLYNVRWLKHDTVVALIQDYEALMSLVQREADSGDPTAPGLKTQLSKYIYVALLHFVADVLSTTQHLNNTQCCDVDFSTIFKKVQVCDEALNNLYQSDGENMSMFESSLQVETHSYKGVRIQMQGQDGDADFRALFKEVRQQVLDKLKGHLESRSHQVKMLGAMQIFQPNAYPDNTRPEALNYWGSEHLQTLLKHYGSRLENTRGKAFDALVDRDSCDGEFIVFKRQTSSFLRDSSTQRHLQPVELMEKLFPDQKGPHNNRRNFHDMYKLMTACMCAMAGDAQVGRVFTCLHQMKPWLGTHTPTEQLNQFITVGSSNIPIDTFPFSNAIERFMQRYATNE